MNKMSSGQLGRGVSIIGVGATPTGDVMETESILNLTEGELLAAACIDAVEDAGIEFKDIDAYLVGQLGGLGLSNFTHAAAILAKYIGMSGVPGLSHDENCNTGNYGLQQAVMMVASGVHDVVLTSAVNICKSNVGMGKPRIPQFIEHKPSWYMGVPSDWTNDPTFALQGKGGLMDSLDDCNSLYAMTYGYDLADMWKAYNAIHVMGRHQALANPLCNIRTESYEETAARMGFDDVNEYLNDPTFNPRVGSTLRMGDINPTVDGAAAVIVCPTEMAKRICDHPVEVAGFGAANMWPVDMCNRPNKANVAAAQQAYHMAGIGDPSKELDLLELHDCTIGNWLTFSEDVGYFKPGEAWEAAVSGEMGINASKPTNIMGGRQEFGHPLGPCNFYEMYEVCKQMRGQADGIQMERIPTTAAIQGYSGSFSHTMTILRAL